MDINGGTSYNRFDDTYNISLRISIPKYELKKYKNDVLYGGYIDKKFEIESRRIFINGIYDLVKGV